MRHWKIKTRMWLERRRFFFPCSVGHTRRPVNPQCLATISTEQFREWNLWPWIKTTSRNTQILSTCSILLQTLSATCKRTVMRFARNLQSDTFEVLLTKPHTPTASRCDLRARSILALPFPLGRKSGSCPERFASMNPVAACLALAVAMMKISEPLAN